MRQSFWLSLIAGCLFVAFGVWFSSGTMAPYAVTLPRPLIIKPCNYLVNTDQPHFESTYLMLQGAPPQQWKYSVVLRRTLFPLLAYPLMKLWGFLVGGVIASLIIQVAIFAGFVMWIRRRIGPAAAWAAIPLLATYPGIYYWAGLPYCYAAIVPASLGATMLVYELQSADSYRRVGLLSLLLGILFLAYDLLPYFAPAAMLVLAFRRKFVHAILAAALMYIPSLINKAALVHAGADLSNENSRLYNVILNAYFYPPALRIWLRHVSDTPWSLVRVFFLSNFIFLPAMFVLAVIVNLLAPSRAAMGPAVRWILLSGLGLFLFINLAPPYKGWQFRGISVARIYQPLFAAMLVYILAVIQKTTEQHRPPAKWLAAMVGVISLINASIVFGPVTKNPLAAWTYWKFYSHAPQPMMNDNLALFGRRPLGFCNKKIKIQNPPPRILGAGRYKKPPLAVRRKIQQKKHPATRTTATTKTATTRPSISPSPGTLGEGWGEGARGGDRLSNERQLR